MYLDYAEHQAEKGIAMTMRDWVEKLDAFLQFNQEDILKTPVKTSEMILQILIGDSSLSLKEVSDRIGKSLSAVERASSKLVKDGKLKFVGPKKI